MNEFTDDEIDFLCRLTLQHYKAARDLLTRIAPMLVPEIRAKEKAHVESVRDVYDKLDGQLYRRRREKAAGL